MNEQIPLLFFGSFLDYSVKVLKNLHEAENVKIIGVISTPAQAMGRKKVLTDTPVAEYAKTNSLPLFTPSELSEKILHELNSQLGKKPELILTAGYGKLLPKTWLRYPSKASLNLHFSLLPKYRGANPAEWALLLGEKETGITLIEMSPEFDTGDMLFQSRIVIEPNDNREIIYEKLYDLGAGVLPGVLQKYISGELKAVKQSTVRQLADQADHYPYARRFRRPDGFITWDGITQAMNGESVKVEHFSKALQEIITIRQGLDANFHPSAKFIETASRALYGFPGLWTRVDTKKGKKRLKILDCEVVNEKLILKKVQLEGLAASSLGEIKTLLQ